MSGLAQEKLGVPNAERLSGLRWPFGSRRTGAFLRRWSAAPGRVQGFKTNKTRRNLSRKLGGGHRISYRPGSRSALRKLGRSNGSEGLAMQDASRGRLDSHAPQHLRSAPTWPPNDRVVNRGIKLCGRCGSLQHMSVLVADLGPKNALAQQISQFLVTAGNGCQRSECIRKSRFVELRLFGYAIPLLIAGILHKPDVIRGRGIALHLAPVSMKLATRSPCSLAAQGGFRRGSGADRVRPRSSPQLQSS
ncbi:hypothetical protein BH11ACT6_BH11ACT6_24310 [soil metagenome]